RLMDATDLLPNEAVWVWDATNGNRFETYAVEGPPDSGVVCVNGAAAHLVRPGDLVITAAFTWMEEAAARAHEPKVVFVDERNRKLLLHRKEIERLRGRIQERGLTLVPLRLYWSRGRAKAELGLGVGKKLHDKRAAIRERMERREIDRAMAAGRRGRR